MPGDVMAGRSSNVDFHRGSLLGFRGRVARLAVLAGAVVGLGGLVGCAQVLPPPEVWRAIAAHPELTLHLVDDGNWRLFEVRHATFGRKMEFRELAGPQAARPPRPSFIVPWKGVPVRWMHPLNIVVDPKFYERSIHRANYRMRHPWSGEEWILAARGRSHAVRDVPLPLTEDEAPVLYFRQGEREIGRLDCDEASRRVLFGRLEEQEVEIEQVGALAWDREPGLFQHFFAPFPEAGEFVIRIDGRETARFLVRDVDAANRSLRLAIRADLDPHLRDRSLWLFLAFDRMQAFVRSTV
jgi:hypothetical protein